MKTHTSTRLPVDAPREPKARPPERDFHGASVVDSDGAEIPITERMVQDALDDLDAAWLRARQRCRARLG